MQNNAIKGRVFASLSAQNLFLAQWENNTAGKRIHGTTQKQVDRFFAEVEAPALRPLPASLFPMFEEAARSVHRDGYVEFRRAYYSVPPEYVGRRLWVRAELRVLRIYNLRREQIALHALADAGKFTTDPAGICTAANGISSSVEPNICWINAGWSGNYYRNLGRSDVRGARCAGA